MISNYLPWGNYPKHHHKQVIKPLWSSDIPDLSAIKPNILPYGYGKSYGDSCLNDKSNLIDISALNHLINFDDKSGIIRCESGYTLDQVLKFAVPKGWFPSSTPGTKFITIGGAVANDVHGKNHHKGGTFGCHVKKFELLRSDGEKLICSPFENEDFFKATIGGLGLTGLITWVEFSLKHCVGPYIEYESIKFDSIDEFFEINTKSDQDYEYTVSWIDSTAKGSQLGRGLFGRGNHSQIQAKDIKLINHKEPIPFPFEHSFINPISVKAFNTAYYSKQFAKNYKGILHYDKFFYPLDGVNNWNRAYGKNGFLQYQVLVPFINGIEVCKELLKVISRSGKPSFMTVLKTFGNAVSPGIMSFPRQGTTLAVDFKMDGKETLQLLDKLDEIVREAGGGHYPAKDARMSPSDFKRFYPKWESFSKFIDPCFSSSFWRRVTNE